MKAIRRIWNNRKGDLARLWEWASGKHPGRWHSLVRWARKKQQDAREHHRYNRAKFWAKKKTVYRRKWRRAKKHLAETGEAVWEDWMANGHPLNFSRAAKAEAAIGVLQYGLTVTSTWRATVLPQSNPASFHGPNVNPGKAVDLAGPWDKMVEYQGGVFNRRKGDPKLLELFGPANALWLKYGQPTTGAEGTFLEDLHDSHVHVAADD